MSRTGVAGGTAVTESEVQLAVRSEARLPAVVVRRRRVVDREDLAA
jgi:hypothetical protein